MNIRSVGRLTVWPPITRKKWWGLRTERIPESVWVEGWWLEGIVNFPKDWDALVRAAQEEGSFFDHRPAERYGLVPDTWQEKAA